MNERDETWSLRWQALQRDLAQGAGSVTFRSAVPSLKAVYLRRVAVSADSWLSRVQSRVAG